MVAQPSENRRSVLNIKCPDNILIGNPTCIDTDSVSIQHKGHLMIASCSFDPDKFDQNHLKILNISLPSSLHNAVAKRKSEFLAGRYLAKIMLDNLGYNDVNVAINHDRSPLWPAGLLGSISHSNNKVLCVTTKSHHCNYLGIDIEHWLPETDAGSLVHNIVVNETEYQKMLPYLSFNRAITLIFSAKESLYKAIFKEFGHYVDFHAAMVTGLDFNAQQLTLTLCQDLSDTMYAGRQFICQFSIAEQSVTTLISD